MAETTRDVTIRVALKQVNGKLTVPSTKPAQQEVAKLNGEMEKLDASVNTAKGSIQDFTQQSVESGIRAAEGFRTAGEGAFALARGIAFVGASSEEDLEKAIKQIAAIQGAFDVFRGTLDIFKGLTEGLRALRTASTAAAAAETGLAAANTAVAVTGAAAAVSMRSLLFAVAPIGVALAAAGAAFLLFRRREVDPATESVERFGERFSRVQGALERLRIQQTGTGADIDRQQKIVDLLGQAAERRAQGVALAREAGQSDEDRLASLKLQASFVSDQVAARRESLAIAKEQRRTQEASLRAAQQELETAKQAFLQERDRLRTAEERFAALDPRKQIQARRALEQLEAQGAGSLNRGQLDIIRQVGGAGIVNDALVERADPRGRGLARRLAEAEAERGRRRRQAGEAAFEQTPQAGVLRGLEGGAEAALDANTEAVDRAVDLLQEIVSRQNDFGAAIAQLQDTVERNERI